MIIQRNMTPEKMEFIKNGLPKIPLTISMLFPAMRELLQTLLIDTLKKEIEYYKAFPKNNAEIDFNKFNPTNHKTCFMGLGFGQFNSGWEDSDLLHYRKSIGTITHPVWGECTLLEIWGGDHFVSHPDMVKGVFKYCYNKRKTLPELKFYSIPFIKTEYTGKKTDIDGEDKKAALMQYFDSYNTLRVSYGLPILKSIEDLPQEAIEDFEEQWKATLLH